MNNSVQSVQSLNSLLISENKLKDESSSKWIELKMNWVFNN